MMAAGKMAPDLIERLPPVRGRLTAEAPLARITRFGVGGPAAVMFRPADPEDLTQFLAGKPAEVPVTVVGVGSNLLVRDGGVDGVVVRLGRGFARIEITEMTVSAGAAALDLNVALSARDAAIAGLEFLSGVPGTIGGALYMNAGAYGREMADVVNAADALDSEGGRHRLSPDELGFDYRRSALPEGWIFVGATLEGFRGKREEIARRIAEIGDERHTSQPVRGHTGGSTFTNPADGPKAWELIERAGCRGLALGGAKVSEKHCNFLINTGDATAADIEALGEEVRRRVAEKTGVTLEWEIRRIGQPLAAGPKEVRP